MHDGHCVQALQISDKSEKISNIFFIQNMKKDQFMLSMKFTGVM
jgi:hypothetical protein